MNIECTAAVTTVTGLVQGTYIFQLKVTDNKGTMAVSTVQITVNPAGNTSVPVANAGTNQNISLPATTTLLTGSGTVSGGTIPSYNWTQTSGSSLSSIATPRLTTAVTGLAQGTYQFQFKGD